MAIDGKELKTSAKALIKKDYWICVFASLILMVCATDSFFISNNTGASYHSSDPSQAIPQWSEILSFLTSAAFFYGATMTLFISFFFSVFVGNPMQYGARNWFYHHGEGKGKEKDDMFSGFQKNQWLRISACILWRDLICICWSFLLIIPGIIKRYEYAFVPYILKEHPLMNASDVLKYSSNLTKGHKMELFLLDLSFIGWFLLEIITFGLVGIFYAGPYIFQTEALAYAAIKQSAETSHA